MKKKQTIQLLYGYNIVLCRFNIKRTWTDPLGVTIMKHRPLPAVVTEGHEIRRHKVITGREKEASPCLSAALVTRKSQTVLIPLLLWLWVPALRDDPSELHLSTGVHLKPVLLLLRISTPRSAVNVLLISWVLENKWGEFVTAWYLS